jgi:hypothetical protein
MGCRYFCLLRQHFRLTTSLAIALGDFLYYDGGDIFQLVDGNFYLAPSKLLTNLLLNLSDNALRQ